MRLLAQRVRALSTGREGINAFGFWHGGLYWRSLPGADAPMVAGASIVALAPTGNRLRSWLDIFAPDLATAEQLWSGVHAFAAAVATHGGQFPLTGTFAGISVSYEVEQALASAWWDELRVLAATAITVGPNGTR